jgi:hypothetical protein
MLNVDRVCLFFSNFGFLPGIEYKPITVERYKFILKVAKTWFDRSFASFVIGCFVGVEQDVDGTYTKYALDYPDQEQIMAYLHAQWVA